MKQSQADPRVEYQTRLEARKTASSRLEARHRLMGNLKVLTAVTAVAMILSRVSVWWLVAPAAIFIVLLVAHEQTLRALRSARRAEKFYQRAIERLGDSWAGLGETGDRFADPGHPYAEDLDLFGRGGVFDLLSSARTRAGEDTLARWLMHPAPVEETRSRQEAVMELRDRIDLREDLALLGEEVRAGVHAAELASWGKEPPIIVAPWARLAAIGLVALLLATAAGWKWYGWPLAPVLVVLSVEAAFALLFRARVERIVAEAEQPGRDLALLSQVLVRLEREQFQCERLRSVRAALDTNGAPASRRIAHLGRIIELLDSCDHLLLKIVGPPLLWRTQSALALESWRARCGESVPRWLEAVGELEAFCSLAAYTYGRPADPFPEFVSGGPCFVGEGVAHPLISEARAVRNDVRLDEEQSLLLVSGSNMSGKSTLLRTVGVNAMLAMAGAPVRARRLRLSVLAVGASMRTHDSLQTGISRFYAEVLRIRQLVGMADDAPPLLFLLDELLHGTNSHDRRIGAGAVLRSLLQRRAIGLATTHDLALADIAEELKPRAVNVHFEDHFAHGEITFDYCMRPGVVRKSNALELMRSVGLDV